MTARSAKGVPYADAIGTEGLTAVSTQAATIRLLALLDLRSLASGSCDNVCETFLRKA